MAMKPGNVIPTLAALAVGLGALALPLSAQDVRPIPLPDRNAVDETRFGGVLHFTGSAPDRRGTGAWTSP